MNKEKNNRLQILRAFAFLVVALFHYWPSHFPNGFLGVDIFLVLSGYLVANSWINLDRSYKSAYLKYIKRRFLKLFPPFLLFLCLTVTIYSVLLLPSKMAEVQSSFISSALNISNLSYLRKADYFSQGSYLNPFLHTWSLSLEWQFYIFMPIIIWCTRKSNRYLAILTYIIISIFIFISFSYIDQRYAYYLPISRAWEFLLGVMLHYIPKVDFKKPSSSKSIIFVNFGFFLFLFLLCFYDFDERYFVNIVSAMLATLYIYLSTNYFEAINPSIVSRLGDASYHLYLYHFPPIFLISYLYVSEVYLQILIIVIGLLGALFSYVIFEKIKVNFSVVIMLSLTLLLSAQYLKLDYTDYLPGETGSYVLYQDENRFFKNGNCSRSWDNPEIDIDACISIQNLQKPLQLIIGDSFSGALANSIYHSDEFKTENFGFVLQRGCLPTILYNRRGDVGEYACNDFYIEKLKEIKKKLDNIKRSVVFVRFPIYLSTFNFNRDLKFDEKESKRAVFITGDGQSVTEKQLLSDFHSFIKYLSTHFPNSEIVIPIKVPYAGKDTMRLFAKDRAFNFPVDDVLNSQSILENRYNNFLQDLLKIDEAIFMDVSDVYCSNNECHSFIDSKPLYFDDDHPSIFSGQLIMDAINVNNNNGD